MGDRLVSIDGERVYVYSDVSLLLGRNKTGVFDLKVKRDGQTVTLKDFPMERAEYTDQQGQTYTGFGLMFGGRRRPQWEHVSSTAGTTPWTSCGSCACPCRCW